MAPPPTEVVFNEPPEAEVVVVEEGHDDDDAKDDDVQANERHHVLDLKKEVVVAFCAVVELRVGCEMVVSQIDAWVAAGRHPRTRQRLWQVKLPFMVEAPAGRKPRQLGMYEAAPIDLHGRAAERRVGQVTHEGKESANMGSLWSSGLTQRTRLILGSA